MEELYEELEKYLKITYENIFNLHHNIVSNNYFGDHKQLGDYYEMIQGIADQVIEWGLIIGIPEATIESAVEDYEVLGSQKRNALDCYKIIFEYFNNIYDLIDRFKNDCPDWLTNKLEEIQETMQLEANFKLKHRINAGDLL